MGEAAGAEAPEAADRQWHVLAILSALMGFASISTDFYLPAMPTMANSLGASAGTVEFTISGYMIGFSRMPRPRCAVPSKGTTVTRRVANSDQRRHFQPTEGTSPC